MRRRRVPGETSAADDVVVVVDVVDADASDASDRAEEGGSICAVHAPRARAAPLRLILVSAARTAPAQ